MKWVGYSCRQLLLAILVSSVAVHVATAAEKVSPFVVSPKVSELLESYCFSCHDEETQKGDIRLDHLDTLAHDTRLDWLNKMKEQVFFKEIPPKKNQRKLSETRLSCGSPAS